MKTIALCFNTPDMRSGSWRDKSYGKKYPGAGWMRHLVDQGFRVMAGESVLEHIKAMALAPSDVIVIQEERNGAGMDLIGMGADPRVLMCLESPIFASHFYDSMNWGLKPSGKAVDCKSMDESQRVFDSPVPNQFKHRLLFDGGTEHVYFPSFDDEDLKDPVPWNERRFLCMVTANKHYSMLPKTDSPSFKKAMETQLHDYRYEAIKHFITNDPKCKSFDLYGRGWDKFLMAHPNYFYECPDKLATIRNYKFALCFENGSYPGYVTEKIIDCLVAGVIPVYLGAPDIAEHVPLSAFIDARNLRSFPEMEEALRSYPNDRPDFRGWLRSPDGQRYNNRVFAKRILELCA